MIEISGVNKSFYLGDSAVHALDNINLRIEQGDYLSVMGPSGSGKSTLLNMLGLLDRPDSGSYRLNGQVTESLAEEQRAALRRDNIGFIFQAFHLIPRFRRGNALPRRRVRRSRPAASLATPRRV